VSVTFDSAAASVAADWVVLIAIEGLGDSSGQFKFCSAVPNYGGANYKPFFMSFPKLASERVDPLGGGVECGELSFELLDFNDEISALIRTDTAPATIIDPAFGELSKTATVFDVLNTTGITVGSFLWIGNETVRVDSVVGQAITVTRAQFDTDAQTHNKSGRSTRVFLFPPYLRSRRVRLFLAPANAASAADERIQWTGHLDGLALSADTNSFSFRAKSQLKYLDRLLYRSHAGGFNYSAVSANMLKLTPVDGGQSHPGLFRTWPNDKGRETQFMRIGNEILTAEFLFSRGHWYAEINKELAGAKRGELGTVPEDLGEENHAAIIFSANARNGACSFRHSPDLSSSGGSTPSTDRYSGTWIKSAHFVDILLGLLTSSASPSNGDELELINFSSGFSNWSGMTRALGAGIPAALVDFDSWLDVKARTPGYVFPGFIVESTALPFVALADKFFLQLTGANLVTVDGKIGLFLPRHPLAGSTAPQFDLTNILSRAVGERQRLPDVSCAQDMSRVASAITFNLRSTGGRSVTTTITDADYSDLYGQGGYYAAEDATIKLDAPAAVSDAVGVHAALEEAATRKLRRFRRPQWRLTGLKTDASLHATNPGSLVRVSHPGLPDTGAGARGWTDVVCQVLERTPIIDAGSQNAGGAGFHFEWTLSGYGPAARFGRIAPSALVASVALNTATVEPNRATTTDGAVAGLPSNDAAAFEVGDVVELRTRGGAFWGSGFETVISTDAAASEIELSGNFAGNMIAGIVIAFSTHANAAAEQKSSYVFLADRAARTIGTSADQPWQYGEP